MSLPSPLVGWLPAAGVVLLGAAAGLFARRLLYGRLERWAARTRTHVDDVIVKATRWHLPFLAVLGGVYLGMRLSPLSERTDAILDKIVGVLATISVTWMAADAVSGLLKLHKPRTDWSIDVARMTQQIVLIVISGTGLLYLLSAIGIPPTPLLLVVGIAAGTGALAMRNILPDLVAGISIALGHEIRRGDRIRLGSQEGVVTEIGWRSTTLRSERGERTIIPNSQLAAAVVSTAPGAARLDAERRVEAPFRFVTRLALTELTGLRATTLPELIVALERVPLSVVHHHSLQFVAEHEHLSPTPTSDFARWVSESLGYVDLGEVMASIDPCACTSLEEYRQKLLDLCREYAASRDDGRRSQRGQELFFEKSRLFLFHTGEEAHSLGELAQVLRTVSATSLYYHLFESRVLPDRTTNDFSLWIEQSVGDAELAGRIAGLDPYTRTAEGVRNALLALVEERIG